MSEPRTELTGPHGVATISTVQDTPLTPRRITVTVRRGRSIIPAAVFVKAKGRDDLRIGSAEVRQGSYADAVAYARHIVGHSSTTEGASDVE